MVDEDNHKTTFHTHNGHYQWVIDVIFYQIKKFECRLSNGVSWISGVWHRPSTTLKSQNLMIDRVS